LVIENASAWREEPHMRTSLARAGFCAIMLALAAGPSGAQSPQSYPYCALDSSSGATSCYYTSRAQCGAKCIPNPSYAGPEGAMASGGARSRGRH
jgi:hypothetical protein